ncbi:serine hydrolase [Psychrosphaera haliotis]|uniref:serine hydrolase domain-containing protein n=1 Tax=Psychrosphaera haliotis TaxID=555083 RepID=UPI00236B3FA8|nr:serine hydrolase [Psychrosphaera haliotis]
MKITFLILMCLLSLFGNISTAVSQEKNKPSMFEQDVSHVISAYSKLDWFTGNLLVVEKGNTILRSDTGMASTKRDVKNQQCTRFNIGSITKHYTAVLILQLIEQGQLSFDTPLSNFDFGFTQVDTNTITIEHLLKHQAGFRDIFVAEYMNNPLAYNSLDKKIALLIDEPLRFTPGSDSKYSNYGFIILGAIAEKITDKSFARLLEERIFIPTGAKSSSLIRSENDKCQSDRFTYSISGKNVETQFREVSGPDGGIEATIDDVYRFYDTLFFSDLLLQREGDIFKRYFNENNHIRSYGGGTGVSAAVEVLRSEQVIVVVLANTDELVAERVSVRVLEAAQGKPITPVKLPAKHFVYKQFKTLDPQTFKTTFKDIYQSSGYNMFLGRAINEAGLSILRTAPDKKGLEIIQLLGHFYPNAPQAYDSEAYAHQLLGDEKKAQQVFKKALAINPKFISDYNESNFGLK